MKELPIIDIGALVTGKGNTRSVGLQIREACVRSGFFYISGHGVDEGLLHRMDTISKAFFALDMDEKMKIHMSLGGPAWRGYFPVGEELTSGKPDRKEGLYFGSELGPDHPQVKAQTPLHGPNLFPVQLPELRSIVLEYMDAMTELGHQLMRGISISLGLAPGHFHKHNTSDPFLLFRIFHYPAQQSSVDQWGVGEHTDYGVLTILKQDDCGGLQVRSGGKWIEAPPVPNTFVCNIGDMLDRMTGGYYRSTPHRVRNASGRDRLSWPFFFDPGFETAVRPLQLGSGHKATDDQSERWDMASVHDFEGTYGEYLLRKVSRAFPDLSRKVIE